MDLEKFMNRKIVQKFMKYYGGRGKKRVEELFIEDKEKGLGPLLGRIPLRIAINAGMKKIGLPPGMRKQFYSRHFHRQTLLNVMRTVGKHGLKQPFRFDGPAIIVWNFTNRCNLRCRHCYQTAGDLLKDELSFEEKIDLINQMVDANVSYLAFSGGEPLMGERFWDVLRYASKFLHTSIATNGTLMSDPRVVDRLADCGAWNVFVSLDGVDEESNDYIRGKGSLKKTLKGLENLAANKYVKCGVNTVVTRRNLHEVSKILELCAEMGVNSFSHYNFIPTGRGKKDFELDLTPNEREDLLNLLYKWHETRDQHGLSIISTCPAYARVLYDSTKGETGGMFHYTADAGTAVKGVIKYAGGCGAGRVYAAVQPNGKMSPCVFMPTVIIGDTRKQKLIDIWQNSELCQKLSDRESYHHTCRYRYICRGCRARALAYGDILGPDPGCAVYDKSRKKQQESEYKQGEKEKLVFSN